MFFDQEIAKRHSQQSMRFLLHDVWGQVLTKHGKLIREESKMKIISDLIAACIYHHVTHVDETVVSLITIMVDPKNMSNLIPLVNAQTWFPSAIGTSEGFWSNNTYHFNKHDPITLGCATLGSIGDIKDGKIKILDNMSILDVVSLPMKHYVISMAPSTIRRLEYQYGTDGFPTGKFSVVADDGSFGEYHRKLRYFIKGCVREVTNCDLTVDTELESLYKTICNMLGEIGLYIYAIAAHRFAFIPRKRKLNNFKINNFKWRFSTSLPRSISAQYQKSTLIFFGAMSTVIREMAPIGRMRGNTPK